jgi:hypothetical protein
VGGWNLKAGHRRTCVSLRRSEKLAASDTDLTADDTANSSGHASQRFVQRRLMGAAIRDGRTGHHDDTNNFHRKITPQLLLETHQRITIGLV